ncbi:MAG: ATP-binding cassette domain-containing protein [Candidatus Methanoplasma sp.]|jgi:ABC-2 type transport system ATP-binding protein|nr:ATP-binding cassette domain-containing protein [Candidatus Methanoplasma sp.]
MNGPEHAIVVEDLVRTFKSFMSGSPEKVAVGGISFEVKKGEIFGILGPNGAGKTTTIKMLSGLLTPTSGKAMVLGMDVSDEKSVRSLRRRINIVAGGERGLYYRLSGRQNLEFFSDLYGIPKKEQKTLINGLLELVDLADAAEVKVENYSRGMKQRIHIARALINSPEILYLDEPTIGLDPEISRGIRGLVRKLSDGGATVILTTHYMFEAEELCDHMIIVSHGKVVGRGTVIEIKDSIADVSCIKVVTEADPAVAVAALRAEGLEAGVDALLNGRFVTKFAARKGDDALGSYEGLFAPFRVKSIGIEEPTLEDAYLTLVGGDAE